MEATMKNVQFRKLSYLFLLLIINAAQPLLAQGFDPSNVDWEKLSKIPMKDGFIKRFNQNCGSCHGDNLQGAPLGSPLVGSDLKYGDSVEAIANSIATGYPALGMPAWSATMSEDEIWNMALYVAEQRQGTTILDKNNKIAIVLPTGKIKTQKYKFKIEVVATGIDPMPFAIAPLPDGRILLTERMHGLFIIDTTGQKTQITGSPKAYDDAGEFLGQVQGIGWMMDVAIHPDYANNGWVYLQYGERCSGCNEFSKRGNNTPVSMNKVIRGRIKDGAWVDEQLIWQADIATYTNTSDLAAGGRIAFDDQGYVYFTVGMKDALDFMGIQYLDKPYGKIFRLHDDGRVPADNPLVDVPGALPGIWTLGHRSQQGLAYNQATGDMWATEMGPRGGDELNRLVKGGNYGWPVYTKGVNYDGRPVNVAEKMGIELAEADAEFPVVDWTPAIAISNFVFYAGKPFKKWNGDIIAGTLRATDLLRLEIKDNQVVATEVLIENLARFRDVAIEPDGNILLLLENAAGSQIIRLKR
jgi:aldose sugar dehydrogenase